MSLSYRDPWINNIYNDGGLITYDIMLCRNWFINIWNWFMNRNNDHWNYIWKNEIKINTFKLKTNNFCRQQHHRNNHTTFEIDWTNTYGYLGQWWNWNFLEFLTRNVGCLWRLSIANFIFDFFRSYSILYTIIASHIDLQNYSTNTALVISLTVFDSSRLQKLYQHYNTNNSPS